MTALFFVINQHPGDGSAHGLYCLRNCWWLAAVRPQAEVHLVFPGNLSERLAQKFSRKPGLDSTDSFGPTPAATHALLSCALSPLPNLHLHDLPALRKPRGGRGLTINALFYWMAGRFLKQRMRGHDLLVSAGFPTLMHILHGQAPQLRAGRTIYEVHQSLHLERGPADKASRIEQAALDRTDLLFTTTQALLDHLRHRFPGKQSHNLGLACGFTPPKTPRHPAGPDQSPFTLTYVGSLYHEQGAHWLVRSWPRIAGLVPGASCLRIAGGTPREAEQLRVLAQSVSAGLDTPILVHGPVRPADLPVFLQSTHALVIPALDEGRMAYVAMTKAYDYLGLDRPILAANLPSVAEVLRPDQEALLFSPGDAQALAQALGRIMLDSDLASALRANCRQRAQALTWKTRATHWWEKAAS